MQFCGVGSNYFNLVHSMYIRSVQDVMMEEVLKVLKILPAVWPVATREEPGCEYAVADDHFIRKFSIDDVEFPVCRVVYKNMNTLPLCRLF